MNLLSFESNGNKFAIDVNAIATVTLLPKIDSIPTSLTALEGVLNFQGEIIPVFSLAALMGQPAPLMHPYQYLVIVKKMTNYFALRVEKMLDQLELDETDIVESKSILPHMKKVTGLAEGPSGIVYIQDPDAFLSSAEQNILEKDMHAVAGMPATQDSS